GRQRVQSERGGLSARDGRAVWADRRGDPPALGALSGGPMRAPRATRTGLTLALRQQPGRGERHPYGGTSHSVRGSPLPRCPPPLLLADEAGGTGGSPLGRARRYGDRLGGWGFPHEPVLLSYVDPVWD